MAVLTGDDKPIALTGARKFRGSLTKTRISWVIAGLAFFYVLFGVVETTMVLSIDGHLLPSKPSDLLLGVAIFVLLCLLFVLALVPSRNGRAGEE